MPNSTISSRLIAVDWWAVVIGVALGAVLLWAALVGVLLLAAPSRELLRESLRILPDLLRLVSRLARDSSLPGGVRIRLWALLLYLALPVDLIPDFIPLLGYADDAIVVALVLRSVDRTAGPAPLDRHWPGTPQGLVAMHRLAGVSTA